jgi:hypothetical protein
MILEGSSGEMPRAGETTFVTADATAEQESLSGWNHEQRSLVAMND